MEVKEPLINQVSEKLLKTIDDYELNYNELTMVFEKVRAYFLELAIIPKNRKASRNDRLK